jgi:DNA adenine methylase
MSVLPVIVSWYGGKQKLARQIISMIPQHEHYVEVFMGGAAVFFNKPKSVRNTLNDYNSNLVNLFIQVRDNFDALAEKTYWTLFSRQEYKKFYRHHQNNYKDLDDVTRAMMYLFLVRANFNSRIGLGFSASIESNSAINFNLQLIERLKLAREHLDGVVIENRSFHEIIPKYDTSGCVQYLDPPYYITTRDDCKTYYEKTMTHNQHLMLASCLSQCKNPWLLSYDDLPEVINLYKEFNIYRLTVKYGIGASRTIRQDKNERIRHIDELIITNFKSKKPQLDIFDENINSEIVEDIEKVKVEKDIKLLHEQELEQKLNNQPKYAVKRDSKQESKQTSLF